MLLWMIVGAALIAAVYLALGGRALLQLKERPDRLVGRRVQFAGIESGPMGRDPRHPELPPAVVERFDNGLYVVRFEHPVRWLGKMETYATVAPRAKGYPVSLAAGRWRRTAWVTGRFGSGEPFIGLLRCI